MVPLPVIVIAPGLRVSVQVPDAGKPLSITDPGTMQVGWVIVPTTGAGGVTGGAFTVTLVPGEIHPDALLDVKLYVPGVTPVNTPVVFVYVVVPLILKDNPVVAEVTLIVPVAVIQVGCVTAVSGAVGI